MIMEKKTVSIKPVFIEFMNIYQSNATIAYRFSNSLFVCMYIYIYIFCQLEIKYYYY